MGFGIPLGDFIVKKLKKMKSNFPKFKTGKKPKFI